MTAALPIVDATAPLWFGAGPAGWGDVLHAVRPSSSGHTSADVVAACGLAWTVEQHPVCAAIARGDGTTLHTAVPRALANVRSDTGHVLGLVGDGYRPLQNADALALCDDLVDSGSAHWIVAGHTRGGARVHAVMRLDREITIGDAQGEDVLPLLVLRNGHDGGLAVTVSVAPFRLACLNGMLLPVPGAARTWKARHTATIAHRLADARRTLQIAWTYYDALEEAGAALIRQPISLPEVARFLRQLVPDPTGPTATERRRRSAEANRLRMLDVYRTTPDLDAIRGTRWGALQAVTAYHDHHARTRARRGRALHEARFERATQPASLKDRALALLQDA